MTGSRAVPMLLAGGDEDRISHTHLVLFGLRCDDALTLGDELLC